MGGSTSLPQDDDLRLLSAGQAAWDGRAGHGAWAEFGDTLLLGYEYRACIKLGVALLDDPAEVIAEAYQRLRVDLRELRLVGKFDYFQVPPSQRLWVWEGDLPRPAKTSTSRRSRGRTPHRSGCVSSPLVCDADSVNVADC